MFAKTIIDSDAFLEMPQSSQLLYFHLSMRGDDDGFINKPKSIMTMVGCKEDDLKILIAKKFIIPFDTGIVVVKHWKIHNYIAKDRYNETKYKDEKAQLLLDENSAYKLVDNSMYTDCIQVVDECETQVRLGKVRLGKGNKEILCIPYQSIVDYLNLKANTKYKYTSQKTQTLIHARWMEKFTEQDFYTVIDKKVTDWLNDAAMNQYLRPETLFGTKFEGYLNKKGGSDGQNSGDNQQNNPGEYDTSKIMYNGSTDIADEPINF
jgi:uncharacterized phage protein (TIGR02220 family)